MHLQTRYAQSMTENKKKTFYFQMSLSMINANALESEGARARAFECAQFHFSCYFLYRCFQAHFMFYSFLFLSSSAHMCMHVADFLSLSVFKIVCYALFFQWFFGWTNCLLHFCWFVCLISIFEILKMIGTVAIAIAAVAVPTPATLDIVVIQKKDVIS